MDKTQSIFFFLGLTTWLKKVRVKVDLIALKIKLRFPIGDQIFPPRNCPKKNYLAGIYSIYLPTEIPPENVCQHETMYGDKCKWG